jgi:hypothetical protein
LPKFSKTVPSIAKSDIRTLTKGMGEFSEAFANKTSAINVSGKNINEIKSAAKIAKINIEGGISSESMLKAIKNVFLLS